MLRTLWVHGARSHRYPVVEPSSTTGYTLGTLRVQWTAHWARSLRQSIPVGMIAGSQELSAATPLGRGDVNHRSTRRVGSAVVRIFPVRRLVTHPYPVVELRSTASYRLRTFRVRGFAGRWPPSAGRIRGMGLDLVELTIEAGEEFGVPIDGADAPVFPGADTGLTPIERRTRKGTRSQ